MERAVGEPTQSLPATQQPRQKTGQQAVIVQAMTMLATVKRRGSAIVVLSTNSGRTERVWNSALAGERELSLRGGGG